MKDVVQSNSEIAYRKNKAKGNCIVGKHKSVMEGINAPSRQMIVQPKLELTTPGDSYEREADHMADFVMRRQNSNTHSEMPSTTSVFPPTISRRISGSTGITVGANTERSIYASSGGGQPLSGTLRAKMESGFGSDFSSVRLHTDNTAVQMNRDLQAKAFTYGNDIYFNSGQYQPHTSQGQHLIAHELAHVVQQSGRVGRIPLDPPDGYFEMLARQMESEINIKKIYEDIVIILKTCPTYKFIQNYMTPFIAVGEKYSIWDLAMKKRNKDLKDSQIKFNNTKKSYKNNVRMSKNIADFAIVIDKPTKNGAYFKLDSSLMKMYNSCVNRAKIDRAKLNFTEKEIDTITKDIGRLSKYSKSSKIVFLVTNKVLTTLQAAELVYDYHKKQHGKLSKKQELDLYADTIFFAIGLYGIPGATVSTVLRILYQEASNWGQNGGAQKIRDWFIDFITFNNYEFFDWRSVYSELLN